MSADARPAEGLRFVVIARKANLDFCGLAFCFPYIERLRRGFFLSVGQLVQCLHRACGYRVSARAPRFHRVEPDAEKICGLPLREATAAQDFRKKGQWIFTPYIGTHSIAATCRLPLKVQEKRGVNTIR